MFASTVQSRRSALLQRALFSIVLTGFASPWAAADPDPGLPLAGTFHWTGSSPTSAHWTDAANWGSSAYYPGGGADVFLPGVGNQPDLNINDDINSLQFGSITIGDVTASHTLTVDTAINVYGASHLAGASIASNGSATIPGTLSLDAPSVFEIAGGTLTGQGTTTGTGILKFSGGTITTDASGDFTNGAHLLITGPGVKYFYQNSTTHFVSNAPAVWDNGDIGTFFAPVFVSNSTFEIRSNNVIQSYAGAQMVFYNSGTILKSAGGGTTTIYASLQNAGVVQADNGLLDLQQGGGAISGTYNSNGSGAVRFSNCFLTNATIGGNGATQIGSTTTISGTVAINPGATLELSGIGQLAGTGTIGGPGTFRFSGGLIYENDPGGTLTIAAPSFLTGPDTKYFYGNAPGGAVRNAGPMVWDQGDIATYFAPTLINSGTLEIRGDGILQSFSGAPMQLTNDNLIIKTGGPGITTINAAVNNNSYIRADSGILAINGAGGISNGTFISTSGGSIHIGGNEFTNGAVFAGPGTAEWTSGNLVSGFVTIQSSRVNITGPGNVIMGNVNIDPSSTLELTSGGTIAGTGSISGPGQFRWTGGYIYENYPGGTLVNFAQMLLTGPDYKYFYANADGNFDNANHITWDQGGIATYFAPTFNNNGTFDIHSDEVLQSFAGGPMTLNNHGTIKKDFSVGTTTILATVNNYGVIEADSGTLVINGTGGTSNGVFISNGAASVALQNNILAGNAQFSGSGTTLLESGNTIAGNVSIFNSTVKAVAAGTPNAINGSLNIDPSSTFELASGGAISGTGSISGPGLFKWTGGYIYQNDAGGTLTNSARLLITGPDYKYIYANAPEAFNNAGAATWEQGGIATYFAPTFTNTGTFEIHGDDTLQAFSGGPATFNNSGLMVKNNSFGTTTISAAFNNIGTLRVDSGAMSFQGPFLTFGTLQISNPGETLFVNGPSTLIGGSQFWAPGAVLTTHDNTRFLSDAGAPGVMNLTINHTGGMLIFSSAEHLDALNIAPFANVTLGHASPMTLNHFSIGSNARFDVGPSSLTVNYSGPTPAADYRALLLAAYDHDAWDLAGIGSSAVPANPASSVGYFDNGSSILLRYTWLGDANCDGIVNGADVALVFAGGHDWQHGDFNYDGKVNSDDYALLNLGLAASHGSPIPVPEPAGASVILLAATFAAARTRR